MNESRLRGRAAGGGIGFVRGTGAFEGTSVSDACILCVWVCTTGEWTFELGADTGDAGNTGEGSKLENGELLPGK